MIRPLPKFVPRPLDPRPMNPPKLPVTVSRQTWSYIVAVGAVLTALLAKLALDAVAEQQQTPFLLFSAAIMLSAWYGGWRTGLFSTFLACVVVHWFFLPIPWLWTKDADIYVQFSVFLFEGGIICLLAGALHRMRHLAGQRAIAAEAARNAALQREMDYKIAQEEISARDLMLHRLVEANVVGVVICELSGRIVEANEAFLSMVGYTAADLAEGRLNWRTMAPEPSCQDDETIVSQLLSNGRFSAVERELTACSGRSVPVWMGGAKMPNNNRVICFLADLTQRKEVELQLLQAKEAAEQSNKARGEFLANVTHELRTPMNAILGMTELALADNLPGAVRDYLNTSVDSARTLMFLLNDLLDFSRIDAGKLEFEITAFSLRNTLDQAMKTLALRASEKGLEFACSVAPDVPDAVLGDPGRLKQVVLNLAGNAIKFTAQGEVLVNVTQAAERHTPESEVLLRLTVSDTGIGISPDDQQRVFQPFTQADSSSTRTYCGTGLGLAIVRQLVEHMQGSISVTSEVGKGTTFHVTLKLPQARPEEVLSIGPPAEVAELRNLPVLVVDDNETNRGILAEMLRTWSMTPTAVGNAAAALEVMRSAAAANKEFPLVIVDALMPTMDGFQFIESATNERLLRHPTILMVSSGDRQEFEPRFAELPISALLEKPVSQSDLLDSVMVALKGPQLKKRAIQQLQQSPRSLSVLVAEDTPANQKVVTAILKKRGHSVTIAHNGREGIDLVRNGRFDVVLMDVQMPMVDGWQATLTIRGLPEATQAATPIIAMTAHAMRGDRAKCLAAGMDDYIAKPLDARELIRRLERLGASHRAIQTHQSLSRHSPRTDSVAQDSRTSTTVGVFDSPLSTSPENPQDHTNGKDAGDADAASTSRDTPSRTTLVDRPAALARLEDDESLFREMAAFFLADSPPLLETIRTQCNGSASARAAHSLKGLAANFGALPVVEVAETLEKAAKQQQATPDMVNRLIELTGHLAEELQSFNSET